jgi:hypothetical protein
LTGQVGGKPVSIHAEGERVIVTGPEGTRQEVDLAATSGSATSQLPEPICPAGLVSGHAEEAPEEAPAPGTSPLDAMLAALPTPRPPAPPVAGGGV